MSHYDEAMAEANAQQAEQDRETARYVPRSFLRVPVVRVEALPPGHKTCIDTRVTCVVCTLADGRKRYFGCSRAYIDSTLRMVVENGEPGVVKSWDKVGQEPPKPTGRKRIGEIMMGWHSGQSDPVYAVASFYVDGREHPDRDTVEAARDALTWCRGKAGSEDAAELEAAIAALGRYADEDYR